MTHKYYGGQAFPLGDGYHVQWEGMTLRDYFAAKAMQASLSRGTPVNIEAMAKSAYAYADAMLTQREK